MQFGSPTKNPPFLHILLMLMLTSSTVSTLIKISGKVYDKVTTLTDDGKYSKTVYTPISLTPGIGWGKLAKQNTLVVLLPGNAKNGNNGPGEQSQGNDRIDPIANGTQSEGSLESGDQIPSAVVENLEMLAAETNGSLNGS
jgi:hypothetical protein